MNPKIVSNQGAVLNLRRASEPGDEPSQVEVLAALLADGGTMREPRLQAMTLLDLAGGASGLRVLTRSQLESAGLTLHLIVRLRAALRLGLYAASRQPPPTPLDAQTVADIYHPLLDQLPYEEMHVVLVDGARRFRQRRRIASGGVAACSVFIKDILAPAVEARAHGLVLVHNHPSGNPKPSAEDFALTARVQLAADTLGLWLLDHVVVAEDGHSSAMHGGGRWTARSP